MHGIKNLKFGWFDNAEMTPTVLNAFFEALDRQTCLENIDFDYEEMNRLETKSRFEEILPRVNY